MSDLATDLKTLRSYRSMPVQKPRRSKQDYGTPRSLIRAVEARWGRLSVDLAASFENAKAPSYYTEAHDSLRCCWHLEIPRESLCWLNPSFSNIGLWVEKCALESKLGCRIIMLVPASIGSEWFAKYVHGKAGVVGLRPRLTFEGCKDPYPKDCMLLLWGIGDPDAFETWRWDDAAFDAEVSDAQALGLLPPSNRAEHNLLCQRNPPHPEDDAAAGLMWSPNPETEHGGEE